MKNNFKLGGIFTITCYNDDGSIEWENVSKNLVLTLGIEHVLDVIFSIDGELANPNYYIGLIGGSPSILPDDTLTSHAGWNEVLDYSETTRQEYIESRIGQTVSNSLNKSVYTINNNVTVGGAFICSVNNGTSGILFAASSFANGDKSVSNGNILEIQYDFTSTSS